MIAPLQRLGEVFQERFGRRWPAELSVFLPASDQPPSAEVAAEPRIEYTVTLWQRLVQVTRQEMFVSPSIVVSVTLHLVVLLLLMAFTWSASLPTAAMELTAQVVDQEEEQVAIEPEVTLEPLDEPEEASLIESMVIAEAPPQADAMEPELLLEPIEHADILLPQSDHKKLEGFDLNKVVGRGGGSWRGTGKGRGSGSGDGKQLAGLTVKGKLALVCDISGSMSSDFPPLVRELRRKFPANTPLILVNGCFFSVPDPNGQRPQKFDPQEQRLFRIDLSRDPHVYSCLNTTDAILMAAKHFQSDTILFNNDLQDGGQLRAIAAIEKQWYTRPFILSGRSLSCDAPEELKAFIERTGGEFKLDPIHRTKAPARTWDSH